MSDLRSSPGFMAIVSLAVLTLIEYLVSTGDVPAARLLIAVIAVAKAAIILVAFMHVRNVLKENHS